MGDAPGRRWRTAGGALCALALALSVLGPSPGYGFAWDDRVPIVESDAIRQWPHVLGLEVVHHGLAAFLASALFALRGHRGARALDAAGRWREAAEPHGGLLLVGAASSARLAAAVPGWVRLLDARRRGER